MFHALQPRRSDVSALAGGLATLVLLTGCANPGPPRPPSLHLAQPVERLEAERVGNRVDLRWNLGPETTDGGRMLPPLTASICRQPDAQAGSAACREVARVAVSPGPGKAVDTLPAALTAGRVGLLTYRVEILNARGRSAGLSAPVFAAAGEAPAPPGEVRVTPLRNAARITWTTRAPGSGDELRIERRLLATTAGPIEANGKKQGFARSENHTEAGRDTILTSGPLNGDDPGGLIDRSIQDGDTVGYQLSRVRRVVLPGSSQTLELRSEPSATIVFTFEDTLPPQAPVGLAAVPGGGFGQPPSIDLSWEASPEADVAGYNVYRAAPADGFLRLNGDPVPAPSYRDPTAQPGQHYRYRVAAVDRRGHESVQSREIGAETPR